MTWKPKTVLNAVLLTYSSTISTWLTTFQIVWSVSLKVVWQREPRRTRRLLSSFYPTMTPTMKIVACLQLVLMQLCVPIRGWQGLIILMSGSRYSIEDQSCFSSAMFWMIAPLFQVVRSEETTTTQWQTWQFRIMLPSTEKFKYWKENSTGRFLQRLFSLLFFLNVFSQPYFQTLVHFLRFLFFSFHLKLILPFLHFPTCRTIGSRFSFKQLLSPSNFLLLYIRVNLFRAFCFAL